MKKNSLARQSAKARPRKTAKRAGGSKYPEAHPPAGIQPRRPAGYQPYRYPLSPMELLKKDGPAMAKLAQKAWQEIDKVNAAGPFKHTHESLGSHRCPEWFKDAKIGMFIDWGPWSVGGYASPANAAMYPDWYELNMTKNEAVKEYHSKAWGADITSDDLINLLDDSRFDVGSFARLAKKCGFKYVVPFLKHHGGFCLWDSSFTRRDSMDWAFHRDFAVEFGKACRKQGLKYGVYVSVGEWDYPAIKPDGQLGAFGFDAVLGKDMNPATCSFFSGKIPVKDYVRDYFVPATKELIDKVDPDLIWWDGEWCNTADGFGTSHVNAYYYNKAVKSGRAVCTNDRLGNDYRNVGDETKRIGISDFRTCEHGDTSGKTNADAAWEECRSFSNNFGYNWTEESDPSAILSDKQCIALVVDVIGRGGNLLLVVSPTGSGELPPRQLHAIENLGDWLNKHSPAVYGTRAYKLKEQPAWGRITHSKDGGKVYLHITQWPADGRIEVPAIPIARIERAGIMNGEGTPGFTQPTDAGFMVDLSACKPGDPRVSVVVITTVAAAGGRP